MAFPKVGNLAPAFSLQNQDGEKVALKDFRDKKNVILYFYPRASTPGCTVQGEGLRDIKTELDKRDYVAIGVSFDPVAKIKKFHDKYEFNFPLLSDEDHAIIDKYGCWQLKKFMGKENMGTVRTTFIIGKDGRLKHILDKFKTKSHHEDVLALIDELDL
ncbi:thioredoxin-dependent thiol peroxidase [Maricurvus nonylphenolicus]|uniref:thioredoxin-dependent thiol peroxidase n=1 Tax=Maricurvus nonylphenolicus TaxID=1008307 RepID=UPI0036F2D31C